MAYSPLYGVNYGDIVLPEEKTNNAIANIYDPNLDFAAQQAYSTNDGEVQLTNIIQHRGTLTPSAPTIS